MIQLFVILSALTLLGILGFGAYHALNEFLDDSLRGVEWNEMDEVADDH